MASISDIRQQYPQYNDMSDQQLADAMYKAHYSDMPRDQFNAKIGFSAPQQSTAPPSTWDKVVASPIGREINKAVIQPAASVLGQAGDMLNAPRRLLGMGPDPLTAAFSTAPMVASRAYDESVANNRNTPGYQAARAQADKVQSGVPSGLAAQVTPGLNAMVPGLVNAGGGMDAMNAAQDSAEAAQGKYKQAHPVSSFLANMAGGLLLAPKLPDVGAMPPLRSAATTPDEAALNYVQNLMQSSPKAPDAAGLRAVEASSKGKPITAAEAIGKPAEVAVGALARRDGQTADALGGQMTVRSAAAPSRILDDYAAASGIHPDAARGDIETFIQSNQKAASPLYEGAYKANPNIASPMLDRILETPAGKKALTDARVQMQNDMSLMGTPDAELMDQAREGGTPLPAKGAASGMKLRVYDYVKRALQDQIDSAYRAGNSNEGGIIKDLKNKLVSELDKTDVTAAAGPNSLKPEGGLYAQARAKAGEYLSAKEQFQLGQQHILDDKFPAQDMATHAAKLGDAEKQAYMGGVANKLFNLQQAGKLKAAVFKAPMVEQKLATLMGPEQASSFIQNMQSEQKMAEFARLRTPGAGSPSAEYLAAMQAQDAPHNGNLPEAFDYLSQVANRGPIKGTVAYGAGKAKDIAAAYATRGMPLSVRDRAGQLLLSSPGDLAKLLEATPAGTLAPGPLLGRPRTLGAPIPLGLMNLPPLLMQPRRQQQR